MAKKPARARRRRDPAQELSGLARRLPPAHYTLYSRDLRIDILVAVPRVVEVEAYVRQPFERPRAPSSLDAAHVALYFPARVRISWASDPDRIIYTEEREFLYETGQPIPRPPPGKVQDLAVDALQNLLDTHRDRFAQYMDYDRPSGAIGTSWTEPPARHALASATVAGSGSGLPRAAYVRMRLLLERAANAQGFEAESAREKVTELANAYGLTPKDVRTIANEVSASGSGHGPGRSLLGSGGGGGSEARLGPGPASTPRLPRERDVRRRRQVRDPVDIDTDRATWPKSHEWTRAARVALGLESERYLQDESREGVLPNGMRVRLLPRRPGRGRKGEGPFIRIQVLCICGCWIPAGRMNQHLPEFCRSHEDCRACPEMSRACLISLHIKKHAKRCSAGGKRDPELGAGPQCDAAYAHARDLHNRVAVRFGGLAALDSHVPASTLRLAWHDVVDAWEVAGDACESAGDGLLMTKARAQANNILAAIRAAYAPREIASNPMQIARGELRLAKRYLERDGFSGESERRLLSALVWFQTAHARDGNEEAAKQARLVRRYIKILRTRAQSKR